MPIRIQYWINWEKRMGFTWKVTWNIFDSSADRSMLTESGVLRSRIHRWNPALNVLALGGSIWYFFLRICLDLHLGIHLGCSWGDNYGLYIYRWQCPTCKQSLFCFPWSYKYLITILKRKEPYLLKNLSSTWPPVYIDCDLCGYKESNSHWVLLSIADWFIQQNLVWNF